MQTRTGDNFSGKHQQFDNFTSDLMSRDAIALSDCTYRVKPSQSLRSKLSWLSLRTWWRTRIAVERDYGLVFLANSCLFGFGAIVYFSLPFHPPMILVYCLTAAWMIFGANCLIRGRGVSVFSAAALLILLGACAADFETWRKSTVILDTALTTTVTGSVERREVDHRGTWRYRIKLVSTKDPEIKRMPQEVHLVARQKHQGFHVGDVIAGRARLSPPSGPALISGHDFAFSAYFDGIGATGFFYQLPVLQQDRAGSTCFNDLVQCLDRQLYLLRASIADRIRSVIGGDAGALSASIITDERRAISPKVMEDLRQSGLAHIVAISGLNMALAAGIFFVGLRLIFSMSQSLSERLPTKKLSAALALLMTLTYYLISGFAVSAERAWIMMSVMLMAVLLDRQAISLRNVAISALVIAVFSPSEIMGASFQMSFAATIALVAIYGAWARWNMHRIERRALLPHPLWRYLRAILGLIAATMMTSVIGGLASAPFSIAYFNQLSPYGLIANLIAMPVMALIVMPAALIAMLLMGFGMDAFFIRVMGFGIQLVIDIAAYVSSWSDDIVIGRLPVWFLPAICLSLILAAMMRTSLAVLGLAASILVTAATFFSSLPKPIMIIHESGELILLTDGETLFSNQKRPSGFIASQWKRALRLGDDWVAPQIEKPPDKFSEADSRKRLQEELSKIDQDARRFHCVEKEFCITRLAPLGRIIQVTNLKHIGAACDHADIVITPAQSRMTKCRSNARLYTGRMLRQSGTIEFYLDQAQRAGYRTEAALGGDMRPWAMHRYYDWRRDRYAPIAIDQ